MNILETYYTYAKLSQAAYIDLSNVANPTSNVEIVNAAYSNEQQRVPQSLAENIFGVGASNTNPADTWTMLSPYYRTGSWLGSSTGHSDPASGFAGMLLSNPTYGKVLAIAGTEPTNGASQFVADLLFSDIGQIGFLGAAFNQLVSLFNYVQELKAPAGATDVLRLEVVSSSEAIGPLGTFVSSGGTFYSLAAHHDGQSKNTAGQPPLIGENEKLTITGHSLGGHVAALAAALFPETFTTAYTFNAPGYDPVTSLLQVKGTDGLLDLFKPYGANPITVESVASHVVTIEAEDAIPGDDNEVVSSSVTGAPFSPETYITTEKVTHDIGHLTESLALQTMLAKLDPTMTATTGGNILTAITAQPLEAYEKLLESLTLLLTGNKISLTTTGPSDMESYVLASGGDFATRNTFFEKYFALQNDPAFQAVQGQLAVRDLSAFDAAQIASIAQNNIAYRYALLNLTPFALVGSDAIYEQRYTNGELDVYNPADGTGSLSQEWINDRAAMLSALIQRNTTDNTDTIMDGDNVLYRDISSAGITELRYGSVFTGDDSRQHILFADNYGRTLDGKSVADHLYGGARNDVLNYPKGSASHLISQDHHATPPTH